MDYGDYSDSYLLDMICESSEEAKDMLYQKYKYIIDIVIKKYVSMANMLGIDYNDLYQEALVGFADALNSYNEKREASLPTFITVCVERRLQVSIIKAGRIKNKVLNDSLSLEHTYESFKVPLKDILSDNSENDPLENITKEEGLKELVEKIKEVLSDSEYEVYSLLVSGLNYREIATLLDKEPKQIDNTIQRIKGKVRKILEER